MTTIELVLDIVHQLGVSPNDDDDAWVYLPSGRSIEVVYNSTGGEWYCLRLHCTESEFDNGSFEKTLGVIEQYCTPSISNDELYAAICHMIIVDSVVL